MTSTLVTADARGERASSRFISRAASVALQEMAHSSSEFKNALIALAPAGDGGSPKAPASLRKWAQPVADEIDLDADEVAECLAQQLRQVREFALLDGGSLDSSLPAIIQLIESGRVELFSA